MTQWCGPCFGLDRRCCKNNRTVTHTWFGDKVVGSEHVGPEKGPQAEWQEVKGR